LLQDFPQISEVDINPLRVGTRGEGVLALDAKIISEKVKVLVS
jgi:succinyl-CoA synthetase beta subunit